MIDGPGLRGYAMIKAFSTLIGFCFTLLGVMGAIPVIHAPWPDSAPDLIIENAYGYLFGILPRNLLLNALHIIIGSVILYASRSDYTAYMSLRFAAIMFFLLALLGLFPFTETLFGFMPLFGPNVLLHGLTAIGSFIFLISVDMPHPGRGDKLIFSRCPQLVSTLLAFGAGYFLAVTLTDLAYWWSSMPWYISPEHKAFYVRFWSEASFWLILAGVCTFTAATVLSIVQTKLQGINNLYPSIICLIVGVLNLMIRIPDFSAVIIPWGVCISLLTSAAAIIAYARQFGATRSNPNSLFVDGV